MSVLATAVTQMVGRDSDHMDWGDGTNGWMVGFMIVAVLVLVGVVVWAVVTTTRHTVQPQSATPAASSGPDSPSAREILDERFARGEIDAEEYAERKRLLGS